ncbi:MAG: FmdB family transcriptional regulator [Geodermatophilaceae bacterium]|nr:FmdB family transcriptional regulator [Geodermatophilaceae bacterium]
MPTYQYACTVADCGHEFERVQSFSDNTLTECPECSGRLRKVWGSIGVVFKGSGFYRNDSRAGKDSGKDSGKDKADSAAKSDSTGAKSESGKSDASKAKENAGSASAAKQDSGTPTSTSSAGSARSSARSSSGSSPGKATSSPAA